MIGETETKSVKKKRDHDELPHIPQEIILNTILPKLSVESLLRFRLVSKHWRSLISNSEFKQSYLDLAEKSTSLHHKRHLVFQKQPSLQITSLGYRALDLVNHTCPILGYHPNAELLASCRGLVLVCVAYTFYFLWNPSTRKYKKINLEGNGDIARTNDYVRLYGLGYDSSTDAYKVVRVDRLIERLSDSNDGTYVNVYNCKTRNLRETKGFPYDVFTNGQGIVVNGAPHWVVTHKPRLIEAYIGPHVHLVPDLAEIREHVIVYFDLVEEGFKEVGNPNWLAEDCIFDLGSLKGSLCLTRHEVSETEVWLMKEYGVRESWTKLFNVPKLHVENFVPLCYRGNNELLVEDRKHKFTTYKLSSGNAKEILRFRNPVYKIKFKSISYVESFVSPPGEDY